MNAQTGRITMRATAHANANIALIKYWGKADESLIIPNASSLSLTIDGLGTTTQVAFETGASHSSQHQIGDTLIIDGERHQGSALRRVSAFLDVIREMSGVRSAATVISRNTVPYAAGLASSASAFAALAVAGSRAAGLELNDCDLSRLARRGSGSASRSLFAGLAVWHAGHDDASSYAEPLSSLMAPVSSAAQAGQRVMHKDAVTEFGMNLAMVVVLISDTQKRVSSRDAMRRSVDTSMLYAPWIAMCRSQMQQALAAVGDGDFDALGAIAEANSYGMHATMMTAEPALLYWQPSTVEALHAVEDVRAEGMHAWATMDAGPNVKVLTTVQDAERVRRALQERLPQLTVQVHKAGDGAQILDEEMDI